jgi:hypothetical protein
MDLKRISKELGAVSGVTGKHRTPPASAPEGANDADRLELSGEAQGVLSGYEAALALAGMPAVIREERISDVQARVAEHYYDRPEVRRDISRCLVDVFLGLGWA